MITRIAFLFGAILMVQGCASSPKSIQAATEDMGDFQDAVTIDSPKEEGPADGTSPLPHLKALGAPPKRVALVSFTLTPNGTRSESAKGEYFAEGDATKVANALLKISLPAIKKSFSANGMEVLTPDEFLTDANKKKFYQDFKVRIEGNALRFYEMTNVKRRADRADPGEGVASGFAIIDDPAFTWYAPSVQDSLGSDLTKGLGVDAVLVVNTEATVNFKGHWLGQHAMYLFGPNPVKNAKAGAQEGHAYAAGSFKKGFKKILLIPKDMDIDEHPRDELTLYTGFDKIADVLSNKVAKYIKDRTSK